MNFGAALKTALSFVNKELPVIAPAVSFVNPALGTILNQVILAEQTLGAGNGEKKKAMVLTSMSTMTPVIAPLLEAALGKDVFDDNKFNEGMGKIIDGVVEVMNSINAFGKVQEVK